MDTQNFLTTLVVTSINGDFWIGLHDIGIENSFMWVDETPLDNDNTRWNIGEPNNAGGAEDCVEMYGIIGFWNDDVCTKNNDYICERGIEITLKCDEDNGWTPTLGKCYKYYTETKTWNEAEIFCNKVDGNLISINSADEQKIATTQIAFGSNTFWLGLTNKDSTSAASYVWSTGDPLTYMNWATDEPFNKYWADDGDCVEILDTASNGEWMTVPCSLTRAYMCERNEGTCAAGWRIFKGNCYQINTHTPVTWYDAKHVCEAQGGYLTTILNGEENDFIIGNFDDLISIGITDVWIGISDTRTDGTFEWVDRTSVGYTQWLPNEPNDRSGNPDCAMVYLNDQSGGWNTANCFGLKSYVCKTRAGQPVIPLSPTTGVGKCPDGWMLNGDSCYYLSTSNTNFANAESDCVNKGSHLIKVDDADEQSFVSMRVSSFGTNTWIGLHDTSDQGNFEWVSDQSQLVFTNWADSNPDYYNTPGEVCVVAYYSEQNEGRWNDKDCVSSHPYMCELPKSCETYTSGSTDTDYYYRYHPSPLTVNRIEFEAKASNDIHIGLSSSTTGQGQLYEVVIGGWGNTKSAIRRCAQCASEVEVPTPDICSDQEFRGFWISYESNGKISVGKKGLAAFMTWTDPNPFQVNYVGYTTGWGSEGQFRFCNLESGSAGTFNPLPTPAFNDKCGKGWEYESLSGNCYKFNPSDYLTWPDAREECLKGGGDLISILSAEEATYINARMVYTSENLLWIGATDASREGGWMWSNGDPFRYLNWNAGEPNNVGDSGEHCAELYVDNGRWNDLNCDRTLGYACKKNGYITSHFSVKPHYYIVGSDLVTLTKVYPEECASQCVNQADFICRSFEYNRNDMSCQLSDKSTAFSGDTLTFQDNMDYYERPISDVCPYGWDLFQQQCYHFMKGKKNWFEARDACKADGGDLAMCKTSEVWNWMTIQVVALSGSYWIGLHDASLEGNFEWVDGTPLSQTISRWNIGEPNDAGSEEDCVEMYTSGLWNDHKCSKQYIFWICQQDSYYDVPFEPVPVTLPPNYGCHPGWSGYLDNCYLILSGAGSWNSAKSSCVSLGGNLASIHDFGENQFVYTLAGAADAFGTAINLWIGLNDMRLSHYFEWSDGSAVDYTTWAAHEPNNQGVANQEDCVEMVQSSGWNDQICSWTNQAVCKRPKEIITETIPATDSGCGSGWFSYGGSCYGRTNNIPSDWNSARLNCLAVLGNLVSIQDRFEMAAITTLLGMEDGQPMWIGLNDRDHPGTYTWSDGTAVSYTNWDYGEPQQNNGNCAAASSGQISGLWSIRKCNQRYLYICERVRTGFTAPPTVTPPLNPTTPHDVGCSRNWIGYGNKCFLLRDGNLIPTNQRPWYLALTYCQNIGGELASFHSAEEEAYIKSVAGEKTGSFWIGLHDRTLEQGWEWSDGSVVNYVGWGENEPNNLATIGEDCTEMFFFDKGWNDKDCTSLRGFVCQIERGKEPAEVTTPKPTLPAYTPCPLEGYKDWVLEENYCYYFSAGNNLRRSWVQANYYCMGHGGYLASVHSQPENDMLARYLRSFTYSSNWLGFREYDVQGVHIWSDGSTVDYTNWNQGEPNDLNGEEQCVEMYTSNGYWNDYPCGDAATFVCKKQATQIQPVTYPATQPPTGYCASGWVQYGHRCYRFYGTQPSERKNWHDARDSCRNNGGELGIIHSQPIQSFLTTHMREYTEVDAFIGLSDVISNRQWRWTDGTSVDYTNWASLQPDNADRFDEGEDCVEMLSDLKHAGQWNDISCTQVQGYICQKNIAPVNPQQPPADNNCDEGYVQYYDSCFKMITTKTSFTTAGTVCQNEGRNLASIADPYEEAFVETLMFQNGGTPVWIGMIDDDVAGEYKWVDDWPIWYTKWARGEPSRGAGEGCVAIMEDTKWDDTRCTNSYMSVCKYTSREKPTDEPATAGSCPIDWVEYGDSCHLIRDGPLDLSSWPEASYICAQYGATLTSIHSRAEQEMLYSVIQFMFQDVWLGMRLNSNKELEWQDKSAISYTNWAPGEPNYSGGDEDCVEMYPETGEWNDKECLQKQGYICKAPKWVLNPSIPRPPTTPTPTGQTEPPRSTKIGVPQPQSGLDGGAIAGIVIGVISAVLIAAIVILLLLQRKNNTSPSKDIAGLPPSVGFDNALYKSDPVGQDTLKIG